MLTSEYLLRVPSRQHPHEYESPNRPSALVLTVKQEITTAQLQERMLSNSTILQATVLTRRSYQL